MNKYYNPDTTETYREATIINGDPNHIINKKDTPHAWASGIWDMMESYTWFSKECNLAQDATKYKALESDRRYSYDMTLAQLIADDSMQTKQLSEGISPIITSPVVKMCLTRQSYEEANHTNTYTDVADSICEDVDRIYNMHLYEPMLRQKNDVVANMFHHLYKDDGVELTNVDKLKVALANILLERLVFPGGFMVLWSFNFTGTTKAISFIERDETGTHIPLFGNIFRTIRNEFNIGQEEYIDDAIMLIKELTEAEKVWTKYISKPLLGFSTQAIDMYIEHLANDVCDIIKIPKIYEVTGGGPLMSIYNKNTMLKASNGNKTEDSMMKTNFFETAVGDYAVGMIDDDY